MLSATGDVAPGRRWRMLPLGLRALTSTITGYARDNAFPSIECWGMLCVWPSSSFTKTHFQDLLVLYYYSRYSTFFFLFHLAGKLTFLWQGKDLLVFVNYFRNIFFSLFNWQWSSNQGTVRISSKILFPSARNSKGEAKSLCPCLRGMLSPGWVKKWSYDFIHHLHPVLPSAVLDASFSPTAKAAVQSYLSHFYWHPFIPSLKCVRCVQVLPAVSRYWLWLYGEGIWTDSCPAGPYPASLGRFDVWTNKHYVSPSFCSRPQRAPGNFVFLFRSTLESIIRGATSWRQRFLIREVVWFPACSALLPVSLAGSVSVQQQDRKFLSILGPVSVRILNNEFCKFSYYF